MRESQAKNYTAIVVGTSAGGFQALVKMLRPLPRDFPIPILVVRHQLADSDNYIVQALSKECQLKVSYAIEGEKPNNGHVYIAPPDRHLTIGPQGLIVLSKSAPVNYSRPSIDLLFQSAAKIYREGVLAVILTGANQDGAEGAKWVKQYGGDILVQDPDSAEASAMPKATLKKVDADYIVWLDQIGPQLWTLTHK